MRHCVALGLGGITWLKNGQNWLRITNWLRFADILLLGNILIQLVCNLLEVTTSLTLCWLTIAIWFDVEVGEPISDHNIITFCVNVHPYLRKSSEKEFCDFNKAEWSRLNELFEHIPRHCAFLSADINDVWSVWMVLFVTAVNECIPKKRKKKNRWAPRISSELIKLSQNNDEL